MDKLRVGVAGLGFGGEFVPIYKEYEKAECVAVCRRSEKELNEFADQQGIEKRYTNLDDMIADPDIERSRHRMLLKGDVPSPVNLPRGCPFAGRCPYAKPICFDQKPELKEIEKGHIVACHRTGEI